MIRNLEIIEINTQSGFAEVRKLWEQLADESSHHTVFQTWSWLWEWWKVYGKSRRLFILLVREGSEVIGIAPLFISSTYAGLPLRIVGLMGLGPSDYLDFIYKPGKEEVFFETVFDYLHREKHRWNLIDLQQISISGPTSHFLKEGIATKEKFWIESLVQDYCLQLELPASWQEFKSNLSKKMRWNIEYSERRLKREFKLEITDVAEKESAEEDFVTFMSLHQKRWLRRYQPGLFVQPKFQRFHRKVLDSLHQMGLLVLYNLKLNGKTAASLYGFKYKKTFYYYLGGFDPHLSKLSLGTILIAHAVKEAIERGYSCFDFLRGAEDYKFRWGARPKENWRFFLGKRDIKSNLATHILRGEEKLIQAAKKKARGQW